MAQNPFEKALADEGLVGTPLESLARSIYMQESSGGKNTKTSNAGAVGGMQILPGTFKEVLPGGNINDPYDNSRAGLRYIKQMYDKSGGDLNLTAAGYYGGPGGMQKAKQGVAVSDPRNPNAPTTLEYAKQVLARTDKKDVSRETLKPEKVIADLGQNYQAAYALMSMADEEPETEREVQAREAAEEQSAASQFAALQKQLGAIKPASPFQTAAAQEPQGFEKGGDVQKDNQGSGFNIERWLAEKIGVDQAWDKSLNAPAEMGLSEDSGTRGDAVRHMTLMREIEKKYNPTVAKTLGYAHEFIGGPMQYFTQGNAQSSRDREMDLRNNAVGLELSKQAGGDDAKFRELMAQALEDKKADFYREEYTGKRKMPGDTKVRKRAEGSPEMGEVSGRTFEEGGPETAKKMLKDVARGVSYYPYDLVGAPVDIINMGLKGVDYVTGSKLATEKPVGGSAYLIDKSNKLGIAEKPTGSASEDLARLGSAFINPAAGARATGRILEKTGEVAAKGAEKAGLAATRAITKNPDVTAKQMYDAMLSKQGPTTAAVRPKGGVYVGAQSAADAPLAQIDMDILEAIENVDESTAQGKAIVDFLDKKVRKYYQVDQGTPNDPIFKGILEGRIRAQDFPAEMDLMRRARAGDKAAYDEMRNQYDLSLGMKTMYTEAPMKKEGLVNFEKEDIIKKAFKEAIEKQRPGEPTSAIRVDSLSPGDRSRYPNLYDYPGLNQMGAESESSKLMSLLNKTDLPPHLRQAAREGEPFTYSYLGENNVQGLPALVDIKDYLSTRTPAEIKNMGYADVVAKTQEWHTMLEQARKDPNKFSKKQLTAGTEFYMPAKDDMNWLDVKSSDALSLEGNIMGHCVGGSNYCSAVDKGSRKIVSLRDKKGIPHVTIELASDTGKGSFDRVVQIKGTGNTEAVKYFPQIDEFLNEYQSKLGGKELQITEADRFLPEKWRTGYKEPPTFRRVDDRGAYVRFRGGDGEYIEEYILRGDPRFDELGIPDAD